MHVVPAGQAAAFEQEDVHLLSRQSASAQSQPVPHDAPAAPPAGFGTGWQ